MRGSSRVTSRIGVGLLLAAGLVPISAGPGAAITGTVDSSAYGLQAAITVLGSAVTTAATPVAAYPAGPASGSAASLSAGSAVSTGAVAVTSSGDPLADTAAASASVAGLGIATLSQIVGATTVASSCSADGAAATASTTITGLKIGGVTNSAVGTSPAANTNVSIAGVATIILNEQLPGVVTGQHGIVVNAVHVTLLGSTLSALGSGDIIVGHSSCITTSPTVPVISSAVATPAGLSPAQGPTTGGTTVTINGTGFLGATGVSFGGVAASFTRVSTTQLTAVTPAQTAGSVNVAVSTAAGASAPAAQQFTYLAAPTVSAISPSSGPAAGGTTLTVTGTGFTGFTGSPSVSFGGVAGTGVNVVDATHLTVNAPAGTGTQFLTVTTPGGTSAAGAASAYTYLSVPTLTSISPASGPTTGGTVVTLTGTGFTAASTASINGVAAAVTYVDATTLRVTTPSDTAGGVPIVVSTAGGSTSARTFTYLAVPTVSGISPAGGPVTGGTTVTISGTGLSSVTAVTFGALAASIGGGSTATSLQVTAPAQGSTGPVGVVLTGPGAITTAAGTYTYTLAGPPPAGAPTVTSLTPPSGVQAGGDTVTISGTNFTGATGVDFGAVAATAVTVVNSTTVTAQSPAGASSGPVTVTVTTPAGTSSASVGSTFTYLPVTPVLTSLTPTSGTTAGGTAVVLAGTGFTSASTVTLDGTISVPATYVSATELDVAMPPHAAGGFGLSVSNLALTSNSRTFTYAAPPTVSSISPSTGSTAGATSVTVTGTHLDTVTRVQVDSTDVTPTSATSGSLTFLTPAHAAGSVSVVLKDAGSLALSAGSFLYVAPAPTISGLSPGSGPLAGGNTVTISGTNLSTVTGVSVGGQAGTGLAYSAGTLTAAVPASSAAGGTPLVVTGPGGSASTTYTYLAPPAVSSLSPAQGPQAGGTSVTLTGTGFTGATGVRFGATAGTSFSVGSDTSITVTSPAQAVGAIDVTVLSPNGTSATSASDTFTFLAATAPSVTGVSPATGIDTGGTSVTVTGTGFSSATAVAFGATAGTLLSIISDTSLVVTSPAHADGVVDVTVVNPYGTSATGAGDHFTFTAPNPNPAISAIAPALGPVAGGTSVTITGSGFTGVSAVSFGAVAASSFSFVNDGQLTAVAPASAGSAVGTIDVRVTAGTTSAIVGADQFSYVSAPVVNALAPSSGPQAGGTSVTITGTGFTGASAVHFGAVSAPGFSVVDDQHLTVSSPGQGAAGLQHVTVTAVGGTSPGNTVPDQFTYLAAPTVTALSPTSGALAGGGTVTVTGTGFTSATSVQFGSTNAPGFIVDDDQHLHVNAPAGTGTQDVTVSTTGGTSATSSADRFSYVAAPSVTGVSLASGPTAGGASVTITGTGFGPATAVSFGATSAAFTVDSGTQITATAPAHSAGTIDVQVSSPYGTSSGAGAGNDYTYLAAPSVTSLSPGSGPTTGASTVTITGTNLSNVTAVSFGASPAAGFIVDPNTTTITATSPAGTGTVNVTVTTTGGTSATGGAGDDYTYLAVPTVTSVSPANGPRSGGTAVTITGTGFTGATSVLFGSVSAAFTVTNSTHLAIASTPAGTGIRDITVTTAQGTSATTSADQFTYNTPPTVTGLTPASGPTAGTNTVTITGAGFTGTAGAGGVQFGGVNASSYTVTNDTQISAVVPAAAAGTLDVSVTNANGTSALSASDRYRYEPAPTVTVISPGRGPVGGGTTVTITGTDLNNVTFVKFGPLDAASFVLNGIGTQITAVSPAQAAGVTDLRVTTTGGTSAISVADEFTYVAAPIVTGSSTGAGPAAGGNVITITGSGFTGATAVQVGGTSATFTLIDDSHLTVTVPAGTGVVDIVVTTAGGPSSTAGTGNDYAYLPAPTVTGLAPGAGPLAGGTIVTITGTGFSSATQVAFGSVVLTPTVLTSTTITVVSPAHAAGTVDVSVSGPGGSSAAGPGSSYSYLPLGTRPTVGGISPNVGPVAGGTRLTITGTGFDTTTTVTFDGVLGTNLVLGPDVGTAGFHTTRVVATGVRPARFRAATSNSLSVNSPAHVEGPVTVTVTNAAGSVAFVQSFAFIPTNDPTSFSIRVRVNSTTSVKPSGPAYAGLRVSACSGGRGRPRVASDARTCRYTAPASTGTDRFTLQTMNVLGDPASQVVTVTVLPAASSGGSGAGPGAGPGSGHGSGNGTGPGSGHGSGSGDDLGRLAFTGAPFLLIPGLLGGCVLTLIGAGLVFREHRRRWRP